MMSRFIKCTVLLNNQITKNQCAVLASGYSSISNVTSGTISSGKLKNSEPYQPIADFYAGKSIFLTGGTGFLGKVFIERLLSNCTELDKIYVLIRAKKGTPVEERLQNLLENPIFTNLKSTKPEYLNKIVPIAGDVTEPNLGIKPEDEQTLIEKVSVVFHSAAVVKFSEPFKKALDANAEGTRKVINLGQQMKNLDIFVHISTAYSNSDRLVIDEIVYPAPSTLEDAYNFAKTHSNEDEETEKYLRGHANPYCYSKAIAEAIVLKNYKNMHTIIVRPSIVSPILRGPLPGWLDSWVAGTGVLTDVAHGLTRIMYSNRNVVMDMIPVDLVCNFAIVAAAKSPRTNDLLVYSSSSSSTNPITWIEAAKLFAKDSDKFGYNLLPYPTILASKSPLVVTTLTFLLQTIPSFIADLWLRITGRKPNSGLFKDLLMQTETNPHYDSFEKKIVLLYTQPKLSDHFDIYRVDRRYMKLQPRAVLLRDLLRNFSSTSYLMKSDRAQELISSLDEKDSQRFMCDPKLINWKEYLSTYSYGVKKYLLKK